MTAIRRWHLLGLASLVLLVSPADADTGAKRLRSDPRNLTLRLSDLQRGYGVGDDSGCGLSLSDEGSPRSLRKLERKHPQRACSMEFEQAWVEPGQPAGPPYVESVVFTFRHTRGAKAGFKLRRTVLAFALGLQRGSLTRTDPGRSLGNATAAYDTDDALVDGIPRQPGTIVVWRTGRILSAVLVAGRGGPSAKLDSSRLAEIQEARIERPTKLRRRENDDRQVPLDSPTLDIDVHWLGLRFDPRSRRLPALRLFEAFAPITSAHGPGWRAQLDYETGRLGRGVTIGLWRPRAWQRFRRSRIGRQVWHQRCARAKRLRVEGGRAVIYSGYSHRHRRCVGRRRDRYLAHVYLHDVVVSVNVPISGSLDRGPGRDPYNSYAGMRAVAMGLRLRTGR